MKKIRNKETGFTHAPFLSGIKNGAGFTLLEILIAIFILAVVTTGSFILIRQSVASVSQAQSKLIAAYLAQEGIEIVKNIRDTNWLTPGNTRDDWDEGINIGSDYQLDYQSLEFPDANCSLGAENYLRYDGNFYNCSSASGTNLNTKFKRKISTSYKGFEFSQAYNDSVIRVISTVEWEERGTTKSIEVVGHLFNWYYGY